MTSTCRDTVIAAIAQPGMRWGTSDRTISYLTPDHPLFARAAKSLRNPLPDNATGLLVIEWLRRHADALSVAGGLWLHSTDYAAPHTEAAVVLRSADGTPDVSHLCRDGGRCEKMMHGFC